MIFFVERLDATTQVAQHKELWATILRTRSAILILILILIHVAILGTKCYFPYYKYLRANS